MESKNTNSVVDYLNIKLSYGSLSCNMMFTNFFSPLLQGTKLILWCDVRPRANQYTRIRWITPSASDRSKHVIRHDGNTLEINNVGERENGYYYCTVSNENGPADQQRSSIRVIRKLVYCFSISQSDVSY